MKKYERLGVVVILLFMAVITAGLIDYAFSSNEVIEMVVSSKHLDFNVDADAEEYFIVVDGREWSVNEEDYNNLDKGDTVYVDVEKGVFGIYTYFFKSKK